MKNKHCLFFIHGFCSGPEDWKNQFVFFKDKFRVEIPLLRGHDNKNSNNLPISICLLYTSPSPRDMRRSRMPSSA